MQFLHERPLEPLDTDVETRTIFYDADNMTTSIVHGDSGTTTIEYDGEKKRVKKTNGSNTTKYINKYYEIINGVATKYIFAGNLRIARIKGAGTHYYHKDHLGSSTVMTNSSGGSVESSEYLPYGGQREQIGTSITDYKFTDQELDTSTGLYNYDARLYDPVIGRFITPDTIIPDIYNPQSLNRYSYVLNNPLKYIDPTGYRVEVGAHTVVVPFQHTCIVITLDTEELEKAFGKDKRFNNKNKNDKKYATLGAGRMKGKLVSDRNRRKDKNLENKNHMVTVDLKGKKETDVIRDLLQAEEDYEDDLPYELFPEEDDPNYNSNSFTSGLLGAVGLTPPSLPANVPGYNKPVPSSEFENPNLGAGTGGGFDDRPDLGL